MFKFCLIIVTILAASFIGFADVSTDFRESDKRDLMAANVVGTIGQRIQCLSQHCNIDGIHKILKRCVERSRTLPQDENKSIDQNMDTLLSLLQEVDNDAALENSKCEKIPFKCHREKQCTIPEEIQNIPKYFRKYDALVKCLYDTGNHKVIEQSKIAALTGLGEVALSTDDSGTSVGIIYHAVKKVIEQIQKLDNGRCANVSLKGEYCV